VLVACSYYNPVGVGYDASQGTLAVYVLPCDTGGDSIRWSFDDVSIVRVDDRGVEGETLFEARRTDGGVSQAPLIEVAGGSSPFSVTRGHSVAATFAAEGDGELELNVRGARGPETSLPFRVSGLAQDGRVFESTADELRSPRAFLSYLADECQSRRAAAKQERVISTIGLGGYAVLLVIGVTLSKIQGRRRRELAPPVRSGDGGTA
jgi:hypothetical protein